MNNTLQAKEERKKKKITRKDKKMMPLFNTVVWNPQKEEGVKGRQEKHDTFESLNRGTTFSN